MKQCPHHAFWNQITFALNFISISKRWRHLIGKLEWLNVELIFKTLLRDLYCIWKCDTARSLLFDSDKQHLYDILTVQNFRPSQLCGSALRSSAIWRHVTGCFVYDFSRPLRSVETSGADHPLPWRPIPQSRRKEFVMTTLNFIGMRLFWETLFYVKCYWHGDVDCAVGDRLGILTFYERFSNTALTHYILLVFIYYRLQ